MSSTFCILDVATDVWRSSLWNMLYDCWNICCVWVPWNIYLHQELVVIVGIIPAVVALHDTKAYVRRRGITPLINRSATWRWVVNFMPRPLYTQGKHPWYQWKQRQPSELVWHFGEENFLPLLGIKTWSFSWTCSLVTMLYAPLCAIAGTVVVEAWSWPLISIHFLIHTL